MHQPVRLAHGTENLRELGVDRFGAWLDLDVSPSGRISACFYTHAEKRESREY